MKDSIDLLDEKALEKTNLNVRVDGPEKRYDFKWQVILSLETRHIKAFKISLFDFEQSLRGNKNEVISFDFIRLARHSRVF